MDMGLAAYLGSVASIAAVALGAMYFVVLLLGKRFDDVNQRFDDLNQRLGDLRGDMNRRFDEVDGRFDRVETRLDRVETRLDTLHDAVAHLGGRVSVLEHRLPPSAA